MMIKALCNRVIAAPVFGQFGRSVSQIGSDHRITILVTPETKVIAMIPEGEGQISIQISTKANGTKHHGYISGNSNAPTIVSHLWEAIKTVMST